MALGDVRGGLSVIDVALLDSRDRELPFYATASFEMRTSEDCAVRPLFHYLRILVSLVICDSGQVSLEHLLLSWYPPQT